mmetsp:Transcript_20651/g.53362  ORF Transcript_20651/g.53362 Transcript_20651/m.53362 type:complete len:578 (+) Transcript_20651:271-2004(+)
MSALEAIADMYADDDDSPPATPLSRMAARPASHCPSPRGPPPGHVVGDDPDEHDDEHDRCVNSGRGVADCTDDDGSDGHAGGDDAHEGDGDADGGAEDDDARDDDDGGDGDGEAVLDRIIRQAEENDARARDLGASASAAGHDAASGPPASGTGRDVLRRTSARAVPPRTSTLSPPSLGWKWKRPRLMTDGDDKAQTAMAMVWPDDEEWPDAEDLLLDVPLNLKCHIHVVRTVQRRKGELSNTANHKRLKADLDALKDVAFVDLVPHAYEAMLVKWEHEYKEGHYARNVFHPVWGHAKFTRAEANQLWHGGIPPDNNALEGKNGGQKGDRGHTREGSVMFAYTHKKWMESESLLDLNFGMRFNREAWKTSIFQDVMVLMDQNVCHIFSCAFKFGKYAQGAIIIPSTNTISYLVTKCGIANEAKALIYALQNSRDGEAWLKTFKKLALDPQRQARDEKYDFDDCISWAKAFYILTPIGASELYAQEIVQAMLNGGASIDMDKFKEKGIVKCTCATYMHYCNCSHVCAWMGINGIFVDYPKNMDPRTIGGGDEDEVVKQVELRPYRIAAAQKGNALGTR